MNIFENKENANNGPRSITILGSTGSIGCSTLDLIKFAPKRFEVVALTGNENVNLLIKQAIAFKPKLAVIGNEQLFNELKEGLSGTKIMVAAGKAALVEAAEMGSEIVVAGIVGIAGLLPTIAAVKRGAIIALANKECLVCSGKLFLNEVNKSGATLLPIDSEHNAIFQVFDFNNSSSVDRLTLTASGGPFIRSSREELLKVTPSQAVKHPNWDMGAKISVDSATMMNKGLELIEAYYLFPVEKNQIDILIHPQSVIHSMVSYNDGSVLAQMGTPDMRIPISYALAWPDRLKTPAERLDLSEIGELNFQKPNSKRFPALALARDALKMGGAMPTVLNAANEVAVDCFLNKKIGFLDIMRVIEEVLDETSNSTLHQLSEISSCDYTIRKRAQEIAFELT